MKAFEYASPATAELALKALAGSKSAAALAGGTDLMNRMKDYVTSPDRVVYVKDIKALAGVDGATIGAATTISQLIANKEIASSYPALHQAAREIASVQIRNMATVGGNLLQRPRCWYFRSGFGLLARKDGKSLVREGDNRHHAIFLTDGDALFVSPSSLAAALIALGAKATLAAADGKERTVSVEELYRVPKTEDEIELTVQPGELLTKVILPSEARSGKSATYEAREKLASDWPLVLGSVHLKMDGDKVGQARIVLSQVAPIPWRSKPAEEAIAGKPVTVETAEAAAEAAVKGAKPLSMNGYKVALTRTVIKRALLAAVGDRYWEEG